MVLVQRGIHGRNDALAESIVERVVDRIGQDAVARGDLALDADVELGPGIELIGGDVDDARDRFDFVEEQRGPVIEFAGVGVVERVLILRLGEPPADGDILRGLHVERDPLDLGEIGSQPRDHFVHTVALVLRLERNEYAAVIDRGIAAACADRRADRGDGRIPHHRVEQSLLAFRHGLEGNILCRLRQADDQSGVLLGKEALWESPRRDSRSAPRCRASPSA